MMGHRRLGEAFQKHGRRHLQKRITGHRRGDMRRGGDAACDAFERQAKVGWEVLGYASRHLYRLRPGP